VHLLYYLSYRRGDRDRRVVGLPIRVLIRGPKTKFSGRLMSIRSSSSRGDGGGGGQANRLFCSSQGSKLSASSIGSSLLDQGELLLDQR